MDIASVMDELGSAISTLPGLSGGVFPYLSDRITPPAAMVGWPDPLRYDNTLMRGSDFLQLPIYVLVGRVDARSTRNDLTRYLKGSGTYSVKAAVDGWHYTTCDSVRVTSATVQDMEIASIAYLAAVFQVDIIGTGA